MFKKKKNTSDDRPEERLKKGRKKGPKRGLKKGPKTLGSRIRELFSRGEFSEELFEQLEDLLIEADVGVRTTAELVNALREDGPFESNEEIVEALRGRIASRLKAVTLEPDPEALTLFVVLGVNGTGKTTTIAKLARHFRDVVGIKGVVMAAGDTFRAAAVNQLSLHGDRLGVRVIQQGQNADPGAVIYDALESAESRGERLVLADTAGRMHTRKDLVSQLQKVDRIVRRKMDPENYRRIMVIDATTGQNGLRQAELFHEAVGIDAAVIAKYDSTAKGGIAVALCAELGVPIAFLGTGEKYEHLVPFSPDDYLDRLLSM
ncbi:MAG: signal recognition particle-docking protein FtsY [bacterium]